MNVFSSTGFSVGTACARVADDANARAGRAAAATLKAIEMARRAEAPLYIVHLSCAEALEAVAERAGMPVHLTYEVPGPLPKPVETAAYFVVCEAVTNAAKHAEAERITVDVVQEGGTLRVRVRDDGKGGADPLGGGLSGLALRAAALDGRLTVDSPPGGPTVIEAELPCG